MSSMVQMALRQRRLERHRTPPPRSKVHAAAVTLGTHAPFLMIWICPHYMKALTSKFSEILRIFVEAE
jgi:hypothetical protein